MKAHQRPTEEFKVSSVAWELDIARRHEKAGFDPIPRDVILRRFFAFVDFLQQNGMTTGNIAKSLNDVDDSCALHNGDLTDQGFEFVRRYHGKWLNRMCKDRGDTKERAILAKWFRIFRAEGTTP